MRIRIPTCKKILTEETYILLSVNDLFDILKIFSVMRDRHFSLAGRKRAEQTYADVSCPKSFS